MFKKFKKEEKGEVVGYLLILFAILTLLWAYYPPIKEVVLGIDSTEKVDEITKPIEDKPTTPTDPGTPPVLEKPNEELKFCGMKITDLYYPTKPAGHGLKDSPYIISTLNELQWLDNLTKQTTEMCYAELKNDIDASATKTWNSGKGFDPIGGTNVDALKLHFDGKYHTIKNLYINRPSEDYIGLFGYLESSSVLQNTSLMDVSITGGSFTGAVGAYMQSDSEASYLVVNGKVTGIDDTGGVFGRFRGKSLSYIHAKVDVTGDEHVGGIGGLVRLASASYIASEGTGKGIYQVGGIFGNATDVTITDSFSIFHSNCTGTCPNGEIGGAIGKLQNGKVSNLYSAGTIQATNALKGGLIGTGSDNTVQNSFWDITTSGLATSLGGTGKTTAEMKLIPTYRGWDFSNTWTIDPDFNQGYPYFHVDSNESQ